MQRRRLIATAPWLLAGCASAPPEVEAPGLLDKPPPRGGRLWRLDLAASRLRAISFRAGALGQKIGHHHILQAGAARGLLWLPEQGLAGAQGDIAIPLAALQIDEPAWRTEAGGEFNEKPVGAEDREATRRNLLASLNARQHLELRLQLRALSGAAPWWVADIAVQLGGRSATQRLALAVRRHGERLDVAGRFVLRHSDHGLQAFSLLGGLLAVADEIVVEAELAWV